MSPFHRLDQHVQLHSASGLRKHPAGLFWPATGTSGPLASPEPKPASRPDRNPPPGRHSSRNQERPSFPPNAGRTQVHARPMVCGSPSRAPSHAVHRNSRIQCCPLRRRRRAGCCESCRQHPHMLKKNQQWRREPAVCACSTTMPLMHHRRRPCAAGGINRRGDRFIPTPAARGCAHE